MNIKDYLHLYLGCTCLADNGKEYLLHPDVFHWAINSHWKPILRPLSDMTKEERLHIGLVLKAGTDNAYIIKTFKHWPTLVHTEPDVFAYLLSRHFDLFGLIDAGLAIDRTKEVAK